MVKVNGEWLQGEKEECIWCKLKWDRAKGPEWPGSMMNYQWQALAIAAGNPQLFSTFAHFSGCGIL